MLPAALPHIVAGVAATTAEIAEQAADFLLIGRIDDAAENLLAFAKKVDTAVSGEPAVADGESENTAPELPGDVTPIIPAQPSEALVLANVGDSRTYLFRHGRLRRVTIDHSYVQELVSTGHITEAEARDHPRRNIITRALGIEPDVRVDWWTLPLIRGDRFVLCSDGLVDEVDDDDISTTLIAESDPQMAADRLVQQANEAGGRDNITVIVLDVIDGDERAFCERAVLQPDFADGGESHQGPVAGEKRGARRGEGHDDAQRGAGGDAGHQGFSVGLPRISTSG